MMLDDEESHRLGNQNDDRRDVTASIFYLRLTNSPLVLLLLFESKCSGDLEWGYLLTI